MNITDWVKEVETVHMCNRSITSRIKSFLILVTKLFFAVFIRYAGGMSFCVLVSAKLHVTFYNAIYYILLAYKQNDQIIINNLYRTMK